MLHSLKGVPKQYTVWVQLQGTICETMLVASKEDLILPIYPLCKNKEEVLTWKNFRHKNNTF